MKVLIISHSDVSGGAAIAAYRLFKVLPLVKIEPEFLVVSSELKDATVILRKSPLDRFRNFLDFFPQKFYQKRLSNYLFSNNVIPNLSLTKYINRLKPDIVHLHWINKSTLSIPDLRRIKAPIVWTLHDLWPITGGCHYNINCFKYLEECNKCLHLNSNFKSDLSTINFNLKKTTYKKINISFIALSSWIYCESKKSPLTRGKKTFQIPNPFPRDEFIVYDKIMARNELGLSENQYYILCGSMDEDPRKGLAYIKKFEKKYNQKNLKFLVLGDQKIIENQSFIFLGKITDKTKLNKIYSASDILMFTSIQENLSNMLIESLLSGLPSVAFNVGGNADIIDHEINGFLVNHFSIDGLNDGVDYLLSRISYTFSKNIRESAIEKFASKRLYFKYLNLYNEILKN